MVLYEMISNQVPWQSKEFVDVFRSVAFENLRPKIEHDSFLVHLIKECWQTDPEMRWEICV